MSLPSLAIRNYQFTLVVLFLLVCLGAVSLTSMPRSEDPQFDFPISVTSIVYPGTNPIDMEKMVVDPIEDVLNELEDLKVIRTSIEDGLAIIETEFLYGSDPDEKYDDIVSAITAIRDDLPAGIKRLKTVKISPSDVNIMQLALNSESEPYLALKYQAEKLEQQLERVSGVKKVSVTAYPEQQVHVSMDLVRMAELNISMQQLGGALSQAGANIPGGHVNSEQRRFTVQTSGDFSSLDNIRNTVVQSAADHVIYVKDIALISFGNDIPSYLARYNKQRGVFINIVQRKGSNIFDVTEALNQKITAFKQSLPHTFTVNMVVDQSKSVSKRINGFFNNLMQGLLLVSSFTLIILGVRAALVVTIAIPLSILMGLGWLDMAGYGLQQMSISGLIIALGLLVDNAIVVTENVGRFIRQGYSRTESAIKGASQVSWAVISGTLTTVLAFFPILLLPSGSGTFIRSMPVMVILTLIASLIVALTLTPMLASRLLKREPKTSSASSTKLDANQLGVVEARIDEGRVLRAITWFANKPYQSLLTAALNHAWLTLGLAVVLLLGTLTLFESVGVSLFPKAEKPMLLVHIETPEGASFDQTLKVAVKVETLVKSFDQVESVATNIGKGNPRVYYNTSNVREVPNYAQLFVQVNTDDYADVERLIAQLRAQFKMIPAVQIKVQEFMQGAPNEAPIAIRVTGEDLDVLRAVSVDVESIIASTAGTVNVDNPIARHKVDLKIDINREKAAMLGIPLSRIDQSIRTALVGKTVGSFRDGNGEDFSILIKRAGSEEADWQALQQIHIRAGNGEMIPLNHLVDMNLESMIPRFKHHNMMRMALVTSDLDTGYQAETVTNKIIKELERYDWPQGVSYLIGGEQEDRKESFGGMFQALIVALLGIFAVLVLQFRSFMQPLIIFAAIPFAITGAILGLWLSGYTFSFTAFVGLTSLVGIVVNNSIILVDYANQLRLSDASVTVRSAIIESAKTRLLPIMLTTLTTIGGLLPLTLSQSSMWSPMGWAIIGGLVVSTLLTLLIVPVLYQSLTLDKSKNIAVV